jgi:predicted Zn-dependent protease with MMP-like domain/uncharacterized protein (DUF952 family)
MGPMPPRGNQFVEARPPLSAATYSCHVPQTTGPLAYHLVPTEVWIATPEGDPFRAASLAAESFIHLTHWMVDLVEMANTLYRSDPRDHVVLTIDLGRLSSPWRYDGDARYPHVYGPVDRAAIVEVRPIPRGVDGTFLPIERKDRSTITPAGVSGSLDHDGLDALFDEVIDRTLATLPASFAERLGSVAIVVEEEASADQLSSVGARGLFGLYQGVPRTRWGADNAAIPSKFTLFRGPLSRANRDRSRLAQAVEDTLLHEIAHHFGIDDDRLRELRRP